MDVAVGVVLDLRQRSAAATSVSRRSPRQSACADSRRVLKLTNDHLDLGCAFQSQDCTRLVVGLARKCLWRPDLRVAVSPLPWQDYPFDSRATAFPEVRTPEPREPGCQNFRKLSRIFHQSLRT